LAICFFVFLNLARRASAAVIAENLRAILAAFQDAVLKEPHLLGRPAFGEALVRVCECSHEPRDFIRDFGALFVKLAVSLFYDAEEARDFARLFLAKIVGRQGETLTTVFAAIARLFNEEDKAIARYAELAELAIKFVTKKETVSQIEWEELAAIVRPLILVKEKDATRVAAAFEKELQRAAVTAKRPAFETLVGIIAEFNAAEGRN
jgi:hypothetical protein